MDTPLAVSFFQPFFPQQSWWGSIPISASQFLASLTKFDRDEIYV